MSESENSAGSRTWGSDFRFNRHELAGSLGDLGTFLPLVVAMTVVCRLDMAAILIFAGLMNILTGLVFKQPIPVQPMKAIAAIAITEQLLPDELVASGILMGVIMLVLALTGAIDLVNKYVPKAVVRGIQLGVGLKLAARGAEWIGELPLMHGDSLLLAALVVVALLLFRVWRQPGILYVFVAGFLLMIVLTPTAFDDVALGLPRLTLHWPAPDAWVNGFLKAALPQAPLTILNSVIAVCALSGDYFPGRGIAPKKMAASVGLMNILSVPFGAIPMCHGAGGLAAQYAFGARTGGSVIMLGLLKLTAGLLFGSALLGILQAYPTAILGPMLVLAGVQLARAARDMVGSQELTVVLVTGAFILGINTAAGVAAGLSLAAVTKLWSMGKAGS